jgi:DNA-binding transcriptional LysR family regulator
VFDPVLAMAVVAVAEAKSFTRAAAKLGVQQPQISERIKKLEQRLGVALFVRSTRRVELTAAGEKFLPLALDLVRAAEAAHNFASTAGDGRETLNLGLINNLVADPSRQALTSDFLTAGLSTISRSRWRTRSSFTSGSRREPLTSR